jgi:sensor histidine kinase regulating citrate/malate metabolism
MIEHITFREKNYRTVRLHIRPKADFSDILKVLNSIDFSFDSMSGEQVMYAVLELLNNSLRAHKEKEIRKDILTEFSVRDNSLHIKVQDWGGGFDISKLPYDLYENVDTINTNNESFQEYREHHGYIRFGIGLYVVRKTFSSFNLFFIDEQEQPAKWDSGNVRGTCIELTLGDNKG